MPTNPITAANSSSSKTISSSSSSVPGLDTASLIAEIQQATSVAKSANAKMVREVTTLALTSEEDQKKMSDANKIIEMQKLNAQLKSQQRNRNIADKADTYQILEELAVHGTELKRDAMKQEDDVKAITKFREGEGNIFQFIGAGLMLPGEKKQAAAANKAVESNTRAIEAVERSTTSTAKTIASLEEVHTEATIQASEDKISAQYQIDKAERMKSTHMLIAKEANDAMDLTAKQIDAVGRLSAIDIARMQAETQRASLKNETLNAEAITPAINKVRALQGKPSIPVGSVAAILDSGNSQQKAKLLEDAATGFDIDIAKPEEAVRPSKSQTANLRLAKELKNPVFKIPSSTMRLNNEADYLLQDKYGIEGKDASLMSQAQVDADKDAILLATSKAASRIIKPGGENIYSSVPFAQIVHNAGIQEEPLYKNHLAALPMSDKRTAKSQPINEQYIYNIAVEAVRNGELTLDEAVSGMNTIFKFANEYDRILGKPENFGLERQTTYNSLLVVDKGMVHGIGDKKEVVDITDPTRTRSAMIKSLSSSRPEVSSAIIAGAITGSPVTGAVKGLSDVMKNEVKDLFKKYSEGDK